MFPLVFGISHDGHFCVDYIRRFPVDVATWAKALENIPPEKQKNMLGEFLYPMVEKLEPFFAPKITGMLLEMDQTKLLHVMESPEALKDMVKEAIDVLGDWIPQQEKLLEQEAYELQASFLNAKL